MLHHRVSVVDSRQSTAPLADEHIVQVFTDAFSPHRCTVEFRDDRRKIALRVRGPNGTEFIVEGKRLDLLRNKDALAQYVEDVRQHLRQHGLRFTDRSNLAWNDVDSASIPGGLLIDVGSSRDVRNWSRKLGCTQSVLRAAVAVQGTRVEDVEPYVKRRHPR